MQYQYQLLFIHFLKSDRYYIYVKSMPLIYVQAEMKG